MAYRSISRSGRAATKAYLSPSCHDRPRNSLHGARQYSFLSIETTSKSDSPLVKIQLQPRPGPHSSLSYGQSVAGYGRPHGTQNWRALSCWTKHARTIHSNKKIRAEGEGDWYGRWERHKRRQYEALRRHVEENPYDALFGASNRWLGWLNYSTLSSTSRSTGAGLHGAATWRNSVDTSASPNRSFSQSTGKGSCPTQERSEEYEIDPITLRRRPVPSKQGDSADIPTKSHAGASTIPVKKYVKAQAEGSAIKGLDHETKQSVKSAAADHHGWLAKEGFGSQSRNPELKNAHSGTRASDTTGHSYVESALDRHVKSTPEKNITSVDRSEKPPKWHLPESSGNKPFPNRTHTSSDHHINKSSQAYRTDSAMQGQGVRQNLAALKSQSQPPSGQSKAALAKSAEHGTPQWLNPINSTSALTSSQVARLRSKLVPLKTRIDTLKDDYTSLQHQILQEKRRIQKGTEKEAARQAQARIDDALRQEVDSQKDAMSAMEVRSRDKVSMESHNTMSGAELRGEGDIASNVHEFFGRARWYKRKAPHAKCEMDAKMQRLAKEKAFVRQIRGIYEETYGKIDCSHRQPAKRSDLDRPQSLQSESHKLNEASGSSTRSDTFGIGALELFVATELGNVEGVLRLRSIAAGIDESIRAVRQSDRQALSENISSLKTKIKVLLEETRNLLKGSSEVSSDLDAAGNGSPSSTYRILAYDHSTQKVTSAKTESSTPLANDGKDGYEPSLAMHQVLNKLYNPGKFLPHLHLLQNRGFDVVSVTGDVVVLKKVREPAITRDDYHGRPNPVDGTTTPEVSAGNFASPTGYVNYGPVIPPEEQHSSQQAKPRSDDKVKRQEDVFSGGSGRWHEAKASSKKSRRRARKWHTLRKMLLTGTVTGALCYGVGVVEEKRISA